MKKQKLTLKQLKQDLDNLKKSKSIQLQDVNDIPNNKSRIINLFRQSSMFHLWLISAVLGYARKIPLLSKLVNKLSAAYGKNSWWTILIKLRKAFVIFNALIGLLIIIKAVGFSFDNILIGFMAMAHTYFEVLGNLTNKLFGWLLNLFDQKIVPNVPNTKPSTGNSKSPIDYILSPVEYDPVRNPKPADLPNSAWGDKVLKGERKWIKSWEDWVNFGSKIHIDNTPWYKETSTWLYLIGIGFTIGLAYVGFKIYSDPSLISDYINKTPKQNPNNIPLPPSPDITVTDNTTKNIVSTIGLGILKPFSVIKNLLNPFSYFTTTEINNQFQTFLESQSNPVTANLKLYPFTENNPYLPWYKKLKIAIIGEGTYDAFQRIKDQVKVDQWYESIKIGKGKHFGGITPADTPFPSTTPNTWTNVGVGVKTSWSNVFDTIHQINVENKLKSITPTPKTIPVSLPTEILDDINSWKNTKVEPTSIAEASDFVKEWKQGASSSKVTLEQIPKNKFEVLSETNI